MKSRKIKIVVSMILLVVMLAGITITSYAKDDIFTKMKENNNVDSGVQDVLGKIFGNVYYTILFAIGGISAIMFLVIILISIIVPDNKMQSSLRTKLLWILALAAAAGLGIPLISASMNAGQKILDSINIIRYKLA